MKYKSIKNLALRVTVQVRATEGFLLWQVGQLWGTALIPYSSAESPLGFLQQMNIELEQQLLAQAELKGVEPAKVKQLMTEATWRLVLAGGFYAWSQRPAGVWTEAKALAVAGDLEFQCPLALEELLTSSFPVNKTHAWVVALPHAKVDPWLKAAEELHLILEGVWPAPTALVERILEQETLTPFRWSDGQQEIQLLGESVPTESQDPPAFDSDIKPTSTPALARIRVRSSFEPAGCSCAFDRFVGQPADLKSPGVVDNEPPFRFWPAWAAHHLTNIDPCESWNLLRQNYLPPVLRKARQKNLIRALQICSLAAFLVVIAGWLQQWQAQRQLAARSQQMQADWQLLAPGQALPSLPVQTLEQQVTTWSNLRQKLPLDPRQNRTQDRLQALFGALPTEVAVSLLNLRVRGHDCWLEGQVKTRNDARELEESVSKLAQVQVDPIKTSLSESGLVRFSLHVVWE